MLHGGRLGDVREDVIKFTSSRNDDSRLINAVLAINKAHVIMLMEQKIIQWDDGAKILKALTKQCSGNLDPSSEDVHMAVEQTVLIETGPEVGGNLHIAKSRNDQVTTAIRIQLANEIVELMFSILSLQKNLIETASKHVNTIILEYTHLQPAQPVTFGHYLISHIDSLGRDLKRLQNGYERVNMSPLGAGALATTSFPINRKRTAELLGFNNILENSIDAVGSRDFILEIQSVLTLMAINLSRLAEDLIIWSSPEFDTVELPDDFTSTSSIMPQKKNPEVLEVVRAKASQVIGAFVASAATLKSLPSTYNLDFQEITPNLWESMDNLSNSLNLLAKLIPNLIVSSDVEGKASAGFVGATELANVLVRKYNVAFRTSHKIIGSLVKLLIDSEQTLFDVTPELLQKVALETASIKLEVSKNDIDSSTNLKQIIESHKIQGGPATVEVERVLTAKTESIALAEASVAKLKQQAFNAKTLLNNTVISYSKLGFPVVNLKGE